MNDVALCKMTKALNRRFWRDFCHDPCMFRNPSEFQPYVYSNASANASWERQRSLNRIHLAVLLDKRVIGEIILKNLNLENHCCTLGIHLQNDSVKNQGYGTTAEGLAVHYTFSKWKLDTVYADALLQNGRSQHMLEKVGFVKTHQDNEFVYYRIDRACCKAVKPK